MRYHLRASFTNEQRKGFQVGHAIDKEFETAQELSEAGESFLNDYNSNYCHSLIYQVLEKKK